MKIVNIGVKDFINSREELPIRKTSPYMLTPVFATLIDIWIKDLNEFTVNGWGESKLPVAIGTLRVGYQLPQYVVAINGFKASIFMDKTNVSDDCSEEHYIASGMNIRGDDDAVDKLYDNFIAFSKDVDMKHLFTSSQKKFSRIELPYKMQLFIEKSIKDMICDRYE
jgi:hypothetical protein